MFEFSNRIAVITGAAGNLGMAVAAEFAAAGARRIVVDIHAHRLEEIYRDAPDTVIVPTNLLEASSVAALAGRVRELGGADILANIAGGFRMGPALQDTPLDDWELMMNLNARSVFYTCRAFLPQMLEKGSARIVNVSARAAVAPKGRMAPYCASKAALRTLTEALAAENKHTGVNVNCILPGTIDTAENRADMPDADYHRWVAPGQLAEVILFLASDAASAVNGAAIPVYGES